MARRVRAGDVARRLLLAVGMTVAVTAAGAAPARAGGAPPRTYASVTGTTISGTYVSPNGQPVYVYGLQFGPSLLGNVAAMQCGPGSTSNLSGGPGGSPECMFSSPVLRASFTIDGTMPWPSSFTATPFYSYDDQTYVFGAPLTIAAATTSPPSQSSSPTGTGSSPGNGYGSSAGSPAGSGSTGSGSTGGGGSLDWLWGVLIAGGLVVGATGVVVGRRGQGEDQTKDDDVEGGLIGGLIEGLAGMGAPPDADEHPHTLSKGPGEDYVEVTTGGDATIDDGSDTEDGPNDRWTVEQLQAFVWESWDGTYDPEGEYAFVAGARSDLVNPDYGDDTKRIRLWIIAIYEEAYKHSRRQGYSNLVAHAYAHIKVDEWRAASLEQFEQTFGTHYAQFGMALSGDALGNVQRLVAEGVPVTAIRIVPRSQLTGVGAVSDAESAAGTVVEEGGTVVEEGGTVVEGGTQVASGPAVATPAPVPARAYLLANDNNAIMQALKIRPKPGVFDVFCHGHPDGFLLKIGGKWVKVGPKTLVEAMRRSGYSGGPVRLICCDTGANVEGAAQQVADLIGDSVEAPTGKVWALDNGGTFVGKATKVNGHWQIHSEGHWEHFHPTLPATSGH